MEALLACRNLSKHYQEKSTQVNVLTSVNLAIYAGEQVAILGSSGSGKSTLLHLLGALDTPSSGDVLFKGENIFSFSPAKQARFRNQSLGFVYQFHHLLPEFSALENIAMPLLIAGQSQKQAHNKASELLDRVGLFQRAEHKPAELSGGERQRTAIARALVNNPAVVLADEPTGNLDRCTGERIFTLLTELREQMGTSFVVVTHDTDLAGRCDRVLHLSDGRLAEQDHP